MQVAVANTDRFPPEIFDAMIDNLYDDKESLATCSLVSKGWLPTSRYLLFREITVNSNVACEAFSAFDTFLDSASGLCYLIKELTLGHAEKKDEDLGLKPVTIKVESLASILQKLPSLVKLNMRCVRWWRCSGEALPSFTVPSLRSAAFTYTRSMGPINCLPDMFQWFPHLEDFFLDGGSLSRLEDDFGNEPSPPLPSQLKLRTLHFNSPSSDPYLCTLICETESVNTLRCIFFSFLLPMDAVIMGRLVHATGKNLVDFGVSLRSPQTSGTFVLGERQSSTRLAGT